MTDQQILAIVSKDPEKYWIDTKIRLETAGDKLNKAVRENMVKANQMAERMLPEGYKEDVVNSTPPEYKQIIEENPEKAFKAFYTAYSKSPKNPALAKRILGGMYLAKDKLLQENIDPNDIVNSDRGVVMNVLGTVGDVFMTPVNVVAGVPNALLTGEPLVAKTDKGVEVGGIPVWKGKGWEQVIHNAYKLDPRKADLISKVAREESLSSDEQKEFDAMKNTKFWGGLIGNIFLDPTLFLGKVKLATTGSKTLKQAKALSRVSKAENTLDNLKTVATFAKQKAMQGVQKGEMTMDTAKLLIREADDILKQSALRAKQGVMPYTELIGVKDMINIAKEGGNTKLAKSLQKGFDGVRSQFKAIDKAKASKVVDVYGKVTDKIGDAARWVGEKTGLRKTFVSDVQPKFVKPFAVSRMAGEAASDLSQKIGKGVFKDIKEVAKKYRKKFAEVAEDFKKYYERPKDFALAATREPEYYNDVNKIARMLADYYDDMIIKKTVAGVKTAPSMIHGKEKEVWAKLADDYRTLLKSNSTDPRIAEIHGEMLDMIRKNRADFNLDDAFKATMSYDGDNLSHLPHIVDKQARDFLLQGQRLSLEDPEVIVKRAINNILEKRRKSFKTIGELNEKARAGKIIPGYEGNLFKEDIFDIIKARGIRDSYMIRNAVLRDSFLDLISKEPGLFSDKYAKGLVNISNVMKLDNPVFVPKDVYEAIERMFTYTKPTMFKKLLDGWDKVQGFFKSMLTVGRFPISASFQIRNLFGNWMNSMMSGVSMTSLITGYKNAMLMLLKPDLAFDVGGKGASYTRKMIEEFVDKFGIWGGGFASEILEGTRFIDKAQRAGGVLNKLKSAAELPAVGLQKYLQAGAKFNTAVEGVSRVGLFIGLLRDGVSPEEAAKLVKKFLFDYGELTTIEREGFKRVMLFYTWLRKNTALQLEMLMTANPAARAVYKGVKSFENVDPETVINQNYKPEFLKNEPTVVLPGSKDPLRKRATLVNLQGLLPQFDLATPISALTGELRDELLSQMSPVLQKAIGYTYNYDPKIGREVIQSVFDQNVEGTIGSVLNSIVQMTPIRYLQMYENLEITKPGTRLNITGRAPRKPAGTMQEAAFSFTIGKPSAYEEGYGRRIASNKLNQDMSKEINLLFADLNKVRNQYTGKEIPVKDIKGWLARYNQIFNRLREAQKKNIPVDKQTVGRLKNYAKELVKYTQRYTIPRIGGQ